MKKAKELGINFLGIVVLIASGNRQGLLSKKKSIEYINILKKNRFDLKSNSYNTFGSLNV